MELKVDLRDGSHVDNNKATREMLKEMMTGFRDYEPPDIQVGQVQLPDGWTLHLVPSQTGDSTQAGFWCYLHETKTVDYIRELFQKNGGATLVLDLDATVLAQVKKENREAICRSCRHGRIMGTIPLSNRMGKGSCWCPNGNHGMGAAGHLFGFMRHGQSTTATFTEFRARPHWTMMRKMLLEDRRWKVKIATRSIQTHADFARDFLRDCCDGHWYDKKPPQNHLEALQRRPDYADGPGTKIDFAAVKAVPSKRPDDGRDDASWDEKSLANLQGYHPAESAFTVILDDKRYEHESVQNWEKSDTLRILPLPAWNSPGYKDGSCKSCGMLFDTKHSHDRHTANDFRDCRNGPGKLKAKKDDPMARYTCEGCKTAFMSWEGPKGLEAHLRTTNHTQQDDHLLDKTKVLIEAAENVFAALDKVCHEIQTDGKVTSMPVDLATKANECVSMPADLALFRCHDQRCLSNANVSHIFFLQDQNRIYRYRGERAESPYARSQSPDAI